LDEVDLDKMEANIGFWLGEEYWRKGYMTEALERIV